VSLLWTGFLDPATLQPAVVERSNRLADAARAGRWSDVVAVLGEPLVSPVQWRFGGDSWFAPLHQAAWHGAPVPVVEDLVGRGALRTQRAHDGRTAYDVASDRGHAHLLEALAPPPSPMDAERIAALDAGLAGVIDGRLDLEDGIAASYPKPLRETLRYPPVEVLHETAGERVWFPVPEMYGGFAVRLMRGYLYVESWIRVVGGSGQAHVITHEGVVLVEEGFV
jgi:hypothetical protein